MRANTRRATGLAIALGSFTAAMSLAAIGTAQAHGGNDNGCGNVGIKHSVDGGHSWTTNGRINGDTPPTTIQVKLTSKPHKGCDYTVSLASYSAEGPEWSNSGHQDFLGWDTVTLNKDKTEATLDVSDSAPPCFGQIDLYGNGTKYDGGTDQGHGALPHFPDSATPTDLITAWNGGHKCDQTTPPTESPTPSDSPTDSPTPSDSPTDSPTPSDSPTDSPTPSDTPTTDTPTPTATTSAPAVGDTSSPSPSTGSTTPPSGSPSVPPASSGSGNLAETGGNGTQTMAFSVGGAVLLLGGGAAVYFTRRRHSGAH